MTVSQLIEKLSGLDGKASVLMEGRERHCTDASGSWDVEIWMPLSEVNDLETRVVLVPDSEGTVRHL